MKTYLLKTMLIAAISLAACSSQAPEVPAPAEPGAAQSTQTGAVNATGAVPLEKLRNSTYSGILEQPITLQNGSAHYEDGGSNLPYVTLMDHLIAGGDLNGEGAEDAIVPLVDTATGSADFVYLMESILDKIKKTILPETLAHLGKLEHSLYAAQRKQKDYGLYKHLLDRLMPATAEGRTIEITYHTMHSDKITARKIDPYKIWYHDSTFFLIGRCHRHNEVRMFVVERIKGMKVLKESFRVPPDFSVETYMQKSFGVMHGKEVMVVVRFDRRVAG